MAASLRDSSAAAAGYVVDDHDGGASDGEMDVEVGSEVQARDADRRDGAGEGDDGYALLTRITDTSAAEARAGKDIQGIPWERLQITRQDYRKARLEQYKNYENFPQSGELMDKLCKQVEKGSKYYEFQYNTRSVKPSILHFQLRNLLWATSKHDVYFMSNSTVGHWSSLSHKLSEVLDFSGHVAPAQKHPGSLLEGFTGVQVSTLAVNEGLLVAGGFQGELVCQVLGDRDVKLCTRTTLSDNAITNAIDIHRSTSGSLRIMVSNNDCGIREFDMERFQHLNHFRYNWPVNHTSVSPDRKLLAVVGDDRDALLVDSRNGKATSTLVGHLDYSFASAWHPDGLTFATGNQDKTCRVWDIRNLSTSLSVLRGNIGAIRCIRYSSDGRFMLFSEAADFVHVYNASADYKKRQEIDFFGEISGISLSPDDESLFVGVCDRVYASLLHYRMIHAFEHLHWFAEMESTLLEMLTENCKPDVWTMNSTLRAFGGSGQIETLESCYEKFQASGISPNIKTYNILLDSYGKAKMYEKMGAVMEYMQKYYYSWTIVTYNVVIDAFGRAGDLEQMEYIFRLMKSERIKPNCVTLCSLIRAYGRAGEVKKIKTVLKVVENSDLTLDIVFFNCLVDAYGRVGCLAEMWDVLDMMKLRRCKPDKVTCTTMIKWFLIKGIDDHRVQYLRDLKDGRSTE